jgi:hypothetical protein
MEFNTEIEVFGMKDAVPQSRRPDKAPDINKGKLETIPRIQFRALFFMPYDSQTSLLEITRR